MAVDVVNIVVAAAVAIGRGLAEIPRHYREKRKEQAHAVLPEVAANVRCIDEIVSEARDREAAWTDGSERGLVGAGPRDPAAPPALSASPLLPGAGPAGGAPVPEGGSGEGDPR